MILEKNSQTSQTRHASEWGFRISADATEMFQGSFWCRHVLRILSLKNTGLTSHYVFQQWNHKRSFVFLWVRAGLSVDFCVTKCLTWVILEDGM